MSAAASLPHDAARQHVSGSARYVDDIPTPQGTLHLAFGLSSCLYSERTDVVERFVAESESGMIHVNAGSFPENHLPFVGIKDSSMGVGGSNGPSTIQFYTTEHAVYRRACV